MADQNDGSIIIDCELDTDGLKSGSRELLEAIKSLSTQVKTLGDTIKNTFSGSGQAAQAAVGDVQNYQRTIADLRREIEQLKARGDGSLGLDFGSSSGKASSLQKEIDAVARSAEKLGPTFQKALAGDGNAIATLKAQLGPLVSRVESLKAKLDRVGATKIPTEHYAFLTEELRKAGDELNRLLDRQAKMAATGVSRTSRQWKNLQYDIDLARRKVQEYKAEQAQMAASGTSHVSGASTPAYANMSSTLSAVQGQVKSMQAALTQAGTPVVTTENAFLGLTSAIKSTITRLASLKNHFNKAHKSTSRFGGGLKGLTFLLKQMLMFRVFSMIFEGAIAGMNNLAQYSRTVNKDLSTLKSSLTQLKNSFATAFAPVLSVVTPILARLISMLASAITMVGKFIAALTGAKTFTQAKAVQEDYAASLDKTGSAAKEAKRQLAGFDELNVLQDTSSDGGGAGAGTVDPSQMFEEVPIDSPILDFVEKLKEAFRNGDYEGVGRILGEKLNEVIAKIDKFISWDNVGGTVTKIVTAFTRIVNSLFATIDWSALGGTVAHGLNTVVNTLYLLFTEMDWKLIGKSFANGVNGLVHEVDWVKLGQTIAAYFNIAIQSLLGLMQNLDWYSVGKAAGDALGAAIANIDWLALGQILWEVVKAAVESFCGFLAGLGPEIIVAAIAALVAVIAGKLAITSLLAPIVSAVGSALVAIIGGICTSIAGWPMLLIAAAAAAIAALAIWIKNGGKDVIAGWLEGMKEGLASIGTWIADNIFTPFINGFKSLFGIHSPSTVMQEQGGFLIDGLLQGITNAWESITSFFGEALSSLTSLLSDGWETIKGSTSKAWDTVSGAVSDAWSGIKSGASKGAEKVKEAVSGGWEKVKSWTSSTWEKTKTTVGSAWDSIKKATTDAGSKVKSSVTSAWQDAKQNVTTNLATTKSKVTSDWNSIKSTVTTVNKNIGSMLKSEWTAIKTNITNSLNNTKSVNTSSWNAIKSTIASNISSAKSTVSSGMSSIHSSITSKLQSALNSARNLNWYSIGSAICSGIASGINSGWSWLQNTVYNLANSLLNAAMSALGIHSPSRAFRDAVGLNIGYGIGEGIEDSESSILGSVVSVADAIAEEFNNGDYTLGAAVQTQGVNDGLASFSDKIANSFTDLMNCLQTIADGVTFAAPVVASGVAPYSVAAAVNNNRSDDRDNGTSDDISSVVIQSVNNATVAIVRAIQEYSQTNVNIDSDSLTDSIINEINRRTRMTGKSPLLI